MGYHEATLGHVQVPESASNLVMPGWVFQGMITEIGEIVVKMGGEAEMRAFAQQCADDFSTWSDTLDLVDTGKLSDKEGIEKMTTLAEAAPEVLWKFLEARPGVILLVEEDGGEKGVTEVTNFRRILKELKRLPQRVMVLDQLRLWKEGQLTTVAVEQWANEQVEQNALDQEWVQHTVRQIRKVRRQAKAQTRVNNKSKSKAVRTPDHSRVVVDGEYNKKTFEASFTKCAAVGSGLTCAQSHSRAQGCACRSNLQCAPIAGAAACVAGFCSYERM